mmetsp:Transcript_2154/g.6362  ORF Transcript_2154/g.6362 Transcript_2154/m.6362 type:complete len:210 (+) Transcript_2154:1052-1681(+)
MASMYFDGSKLGMFAGSKPGGGAAAAAGSAGAAAAPSAPGCTRPAMLSCKVLVICEKAGSWAICSAIDLMLGSLRTFWRAERSNPPRAPGIPGGGAPPEPLAPGASAIFVYVDYLRTAEHEGHTRVRGHRCKQAGRVGGMAAGIVHSLQSLKYCAGAVIMPRKRSCWGQGERRAIGRNVSGTECWEFEMDGQHRWPVAAVPAGRSRQRT